MRLVFDSEDDDGFCATRDLLLERFENWVIDEGLAAGDDAATVCADASVALDWKHGYGDGHLARWRSGEVAEYLLEWCPRKLSVSPVECRSVPEALLLFVRFLASEGLLAAGSSRPPAIGAAVAAITEEFVAAMGDPSKFGMAKSLFAAALGDGIDISDQDDLNAWMQEFNNRPFEERREVMAGESVRHVAGRRLPTLPPVVPPDDDAVDASRAAAPILAKFAALAEFIGPEGRKLTQTGQLTLADARLLVDRLATGDTIDPVIGHKTYKTKSSAELGELRLVFAWARKAGILRVAHGRVFATKRGLALGRDPAGEFERCVDALMSMGALSAQQDPQGWMTWPEVVALMDDMVVHFLGGSYAAQGPIPIRDVAGLAARAVLDEFEFPMLDDERVTRIVGHRVLDIVGVLVLAGMVHIDEGRAQSTGEPSLDGTIGLTDAGVVTARRLLIEAGYDAPAGGRFAMATATELLLGVDIEDVLAVCAEIEGWRRKHESMDAARQLADAAIALDGAARHLALAILDDLDVDVAAPEVRRIADEPSARGLGLCWLVDHGLEDPAALFDPRDVSWFADVLARRMVTGGPEALRATLGLAGVRQRQIDVVAEVGRSSSDSAEVVLICLAKTHPDKFVARAADRAILQRESE